MHGGSGDEDGGRAYIDRQTAKAWQLFEPRWQRKRLSEIVHVFPPLVPAPPQVEWRHFKHEKQQLSHYVRNTAAQVGNAPKRVAVFETSRGKISHINALLTATHRKMFDLPPIIFCCKPPARTFIGSSAHWLERTLSRLHSASTVRRLNHTPERAYARPAFGPARS